MTIKLSNYIIVTKMAEEGQGGWVGETKRKQWAMLK